MRIVRMILAAVLLTGSAAAADARAQGANANNSAQASTSSSVRAGDSVPDRKRSHKDHHKGPPVNPVCHDTKSNRCAATVSPQ